MKRHREHLRSLWEVSRTVNGASHLTTYSQADVYCTIHRLPSSLSLCCYVASGQHLTSECKFSLVHSNILPRHKRSNAVGTLLLIQSLWNSASNVRAGKMFISWASVRRSQCLKEIVYAKMNHCQLHDIKGHMTFFPPWNETEVL